MITLCCAVISDGSVIAIDIDGKDLVAHLKDKIKEKKQYSFPAADLQLRKVNGTLEETKDQGIFQYNEKEVRVSDEKMFENAEIMLSSRLVISKYFTNGAPTDCIHVLVKCPVKISRHKHGEYKGMSVEASNRKYLDAVAQKIALKYNFKYAYKNPTMGDVFRALDNKKWKPHEGENQVQMDEIFSKDKWEILRNLNLKTNHRIHDGILRTTSSGKPILILCHNDLTDAEKLKEIAVEIGLVASPDILVVKDEDVLSGSSGSISGSDIKHE